MLSDHVFTYALFIQFESVLEVVDNALSSAAEKTPKDVDEKFKKAIAALSAYEKRRHSKETVAKKMEDAETKDKSSSTTLNRLKAKLLVRERAFTLALFQY